MTQDYLAHVTSTSALKRMLDLTTYHPYTQIQMHQGGGDVIDLSVSSVLARRVSDDNSTYHVPRGPNVWMRRREKGLTFSRIIHSLVIKVPVINDEAIFISKNNFCAKELCLTRGVCFICSNT